MVIGNTAGQFDVINEIRNVALLPEADLQVRLSAALHSVLSEQLYHFVNLNQKTLHYPPLGVQMEVSLIQVTPSETKAGLFSKKVANYDVDVMVNTLVRGSSRREQFKSIAKIKIADGKIEIPKQSMAELGSIFSTLEGKVKLLSAAERTSPIRQVLSKLLSEGLSTEEIRRKMLHFDWEKYCQ